MFPFSPYFKYREINNLHPSIIISLLWTTLNNTPKKWRNVSTVLKNGEMSEGKVFASQEKGKN